jgi:cbb3-type cytochrome oxidase subunit 3
MTTQQIVIRSTILAAFLLVFLIIAGVIHAYAAEQRTIYNDKGQEIGRVEKRGNETQFFNNKGQDLGRAERGNNGTTFIDNMGREVGRMKR